VTELIPPPLAALGGAVPPAPEWFDAAIAHAPEERRVTVDGAEIELLVWGPEGAPGLLFIHGGMAHARWWAHIAPLFADRFRVAAFSMSGMGGSDWRDAYSIETYVAEALACADAAGLGTAGPPVIIGHSMGAAPALLAAHWHGPRFSGAILLDSGVRPPAKQLWARRMLPGRKIYPDVTAALARFRLMPEQPVEHLFIVDAIARASLIEDGGSWRWCFDPDFFTRMAPWDSWPALGAPGCPLAVIHAEWSRVAPAELIAEQRAQAPAGTPFVRVERAHHHLMIDRPLEMVAAIDAQLRQWGHVPA
jgi:pimeloyl-ACP methyl ester carboxylesterase